MREHKYTSFKSVAFEGRRIDEVEFVIVKDEERRTAFGPYFQLCGASLKAGSGQFVVGDVGQLKLAIPTANGYDFDMTLGPLTVSQTNADGTTILSDPSFRAIPTDEQIAAIDAELARLHTDIRLRFLFAYCRLTGERGLSGAVSRGEDAQRLAFTAVLDTIQQWYRTHYGSKCDAFGGFGVRPIMIRGTTFLLRLPPTFNASREIPVRPYIEGMQESLWNVMSDDEKQQVQQRFNMMYVEGSDLALLLVTLPQKTWKNVAIADSYVSRGYAELQATCEGFHLSDASGVISNMNQAVEKYLKAFVVLCDPKMNDSKIRRKYNHRIGDLIDAAAGFNSEFHRLQRVKDKFLEPTSVRYQPQSMPLVARIEKIDSAYSVCHLVTKILLKCGNDARRLVTGKPADRERAE